ncbi:MAG: ATP-binding cassette domain-containing protein [Reyranellaceae bacterium]
MTRLKAVGLSKRFGGLVAVDRLSLSVEPGSVVGIIGPNGSGKSTVFNLIMGVETPDAGEVHYDGRRIDGWKLHRLARLGIGRTFQEVKIFRDLPVWENLEIAAIGRGLADWQARGRSWLTEMGIAHLTDEPADSLSIGQQRLLELAMNLLVEPELLLLDEPLAGVHPVVRNRIGAVIRAQRAAGRTFLLIEHDMRFVMEICDRLIVLQQGRKIAEGPPDAVRADEGVIRALLGGTAAA